MKEIVLNEMEWAEGAIDSLTLGKKPYETIVRVAKYYKAKGYKKNDIRRKVEDFMIRCQPRLSLVKWENSITAAINAAEKYPPICLNGVAITDTEIRKIEELPSLLQQRVMFTLVCLAKYGNAINKNNGNWVNIEQKDIFALANVTLSSKRQSLMINDLWQAGYIGYSCLVDNTNLSVKILSDGDTAMFIDDFRNLGNQYMRYHGGEYFECECCGVVLKVSNAKAHQKYCKECAGAVKANRDSDRNYVMRINRQFLKASQANMA